MNASEPIVLILMAIAPFVAVWFRARTRKLQKELEAEGTGPPEHTDRDEHPTLTKMFVELSAKVEQLETQLKSALKTIDQYQVNEERLIERIANTSVELRIVQLERDRLYEYVSANMTLKLTKET